MSRYLSLALAAAGLALGGDTIARRFGAALQPYQRAFIKRTTQEPSRKTKGRTGARARVEARKAWNARRR